MEREWQNLETETFEAIGTTSLGPRDEQQDAILLQKGTGVLKSLYVVCDGHGALGGCSTKCAEMFANHIQLLFEKDPKQTPYAAIRAALQLTDEELCQQLSEDVESILESWQGESEAKEALELLGEDFFRRELGSGTTLAAVLEHESGLYVAHVGDSDVYHLSQGTEEIARCTEPHNWEEDEDTVTSEFGVVYKHDLAVARALGHPKLKDAQLLSAWPEITKLETFETGDFLLLCSDGLIVLTDKEKVDALLLFTEEQNLEQAADALMKAAEENPIDNMSIIVLHNKA